MEVSAPFQQTHLLCRQQLSTEEQLGKDPWLPGGTATSPAWSLKAQSAPESYSVLHWSDVHPSQAGFLGAELSRKQPSWATTSPFQTPKFLPLN